MAENKFMNASLDYDVVIVGAGISGLYQLYSLRKVGFRVCILERGTGVGGTWYWNRYPGARFDSESYSYAYSFSDELLEEWNWSEHFAGQPEILRYLEYVSQKFDLLKDIKFSTDVTSAVYDEKRSYWNIKSGNDVTYKARILITAVGILSEPTFPNIPGIENFQGDYFHTAKWPKTPVTFNGKNVAVIGTGASGVQTIQEVAKSANQLTVFQRRPNWCAPLNNEAIGPAEMEKIRSNYEDMFLKCSQSQGGFIWSIDPRSTFEVTLEEREIFWESLYSSRGMNIYQGNFRDVLVNPEANKAMSGFVADKIRERVNDPEIAEMLIPSDHGFGTRRVPLETRYYEAYNQNNVDLVNLNQNPIRKITETGISTSEAEYKLDLIVYATGFNAITGSFDRMNIRGLKGHTLGAKWDSGPSTFLSMQVGDFPNLLMINGPQGFGGNHPRNIEYTVEWLTNLINFMRSNDFTQVEPTPSAINNWNDHVQDKSSKSLVNYVDSWMTGVNSNVSNKHTRVVGLRYGGSLQSYRGICDDVVSRDYSDMKFS
ncbi:MAG: NAD(P)/FAD-dependent oxidoreductase [Chloroflexota bacterium]|nr:NAD(P)/FAD-dependent oxidoreductase [Chloroflexota bacterium]